MNEISEEEEQTKFQTSKLKFNIDSLLATDEDSKAGIQQQQMELLKQQEQLSIFSREIMLKQG